MIWPFIIILFGLEIIYRIAIIKEKIKLDWISTSILIVLVLLIGSIASVGRYHLDMKKMMNTKYKYNENISEEIVLEKSKRLIIDESDIDIIIRNDNYKNIRIILESIYKHNGNEEDSYDKLKLINVEENGKTTTIGRYIKNRREFKKINIENKRYLIYLPSDIDLEIRNRHGNVSLALPRDQAGKFNIVASYGRIYDGLDFNIIESASKDRINEFRESMKPEYSIRVNNGNVILETN